ncbi:MAG: Hypothetical protein BHV28_00700 [Candidatus Tokpelaia hoelldobleri]|uniref:Uncharacterized protein n=1 Tax=Candidatus Tokpelaia hoelldobleri TaxID=1902579 RepID=A0A1U9JSF8_9HYPH|nr:MAG: Hypothetical protein BHV28_00700 [Candidatus Tokpelaia hoelldoblerii]
MTDISFWKARVFQFSLVFIGGILLLQPVWAFVYLVTAGVLFDLVATVKGVFSIIITVYPKEVVTATLIAFVMALRSATWGSISLVFTIGTTAFLAAVMEAGTRVIAAFYPDTLIEAGFGRESFWLWLLAWLVAACVFYAALAFCGLNRRYHVDERENLHHAFWAVVIFALYCPIIYGLLYFRIMYGDELALLIARYGALPAKGGYIPFLMAGGTGFFLLAHLRANAIVSVRFLFGVVGAVCAIFCLLQMVDDLSLWRFYLIFYPMFALCSALLGWVLLRFLGVPGESPVFSTRIVATGQKKGRFYRSFGLWVFVVTVLVAPFAWHMLAIVLRAVLLGVPPLTYWGTGLGISYGKVGLFFAVPAGLYAAWKGRVDFTALFVCAFVALLPEMRFLPESYGVSLGWYYDYLGWPMLIYAGVCVAVWLVLVMTRNTAAKYFRF